MSSATESFDAQTAKLIDAAHRCDTLPSIEDYLPYHNFGEMWESLAGAHGQRTWMTYYPCAADDETPTHFTFTQFADLIERVATLLSEKFGIKAGGAVATLTINQPLTVAIYFAAWRLGARVVPVNPSEADDRVGYIVQNSGATVLIAHRSCREDWAGVEAAIPKTVSRAILLDAAGGPVGWEDFGSLLEGVKSSGKSTVPSVSWDSEALVVYTSGTTGNPKGVVLTQKQMFADAYAISQWHGIDEHTVMMNVLPIHHVNGIIVTLVTPAFGGAHVVVNKRFRSGGFWRKLAQNNVAIVSVVPTLLQFLFESNEEFAPEDLPNFRHFICGAGPLSVELARDFQDRFGLKIMHGYGLSETVCYSCFLPTDLEWDEHCAWMYDHGFPSIGAPVITNEMAIHDDQGQPVEDGKKGEIVIRGHNVMVGYFRNPEANATAFKFAWFRSGDEGFKLRGEDGKDYFFITGRIKELIIRGGINLSPFEIDEVLNSMPGIRVGLAVGFDNRYYGEEVGAYVQVEKGTTLTEAQVIAHCKEKLPWSKCPKVVIFGDDIPVTSTGKYQRGKLKHLYEAHKDRQFKE
ncbi:MAG TPA: class I adenylate-forming enzyme family protein [Phycisphaerae bacterium]|nr:class I adenylate-forming enzyme family protein [Phycisphaerae bacterium]